MTADKGQTPIRLAAGEDVARYRRMALEHGACASCLDGAPEAFGCWDCQNTGWDGGNPFDRIATLTAQLAAAEARVAGLERERDHWRANHDEMVARNAVLRDRPDLPVDRLPALARLDALLASRAVLRNLTQETDNAE